MTELLLAIFFIIIVFGASILFTGASMMSQICNRDCLALLERPLGKE